MTAALRPDLDMSDVLAAEFADACAQLAQAQRARRQKDTPTHRAGVDEALARVDAVLDLYLEHR